MLFNLVLHTDDGVSYGVTVPALSGCFSAGDNMEQAVANAKEAIIFHLEGDLDDGREPEIHTVTLDDIKVHEDYKDGHFVTVDIDISHYTLKAERFNVSWPKNVLRRVDEYVANTHDNRSNFLVKAAISYIEEKR